MSFLNRRPVAFAWIVLGAAAVIGLLLLYKTSLLTVLRPGETITVQLARNYKLDADNTIVKMAGSKIGVVQDISGTGPVDVKLKVNFGTRELLGTEPTAKVRPTTVLGGLYFVELSSGGARGEFTGDAIPVERTGLPVELDRVLAAIPPDAQAGLQGMTERLDATLKAGTGAELNRFLANAPETLRPAGPVLDALRGVNPDADLARLVTDLNSTARTLTATPGQLRQVVDSLAGTSREFGANAAPLAATIGSLPDTLRATRTGAADLRGTLDKLVETAPDARQIVRELDPALAELAPAVAELRPVLADLRPLLDDAEPLVEELTPTLREADDVLDDLSGPVLDRVNGPILNALNTEWRGEAPKYPNGGRDGALFYQELAYLFAHLDNDVRFQNDTSHMIGFGVGAGPTSLYGTGPLGQAVQRTLSELTGPPHSGSRGGAPTAVLPGMKPVDPDPGLPKPPVLDPNKPGIPLLGEGPNR